MTMQSRFLENDAVQSMKALAKELGVVIPVSFYEAERADSFSTQWR